MDASRGFPKNERGVFDIENIPEPPPPTPLPQVGLPFPTQHFGHTGRETFSPPIITMPHLGVLTEAYEECLLHCFPPIRIFFGFLGTYLPCFLMIIGAILLFQGGSGSTWCSANLLGAATVLPTTSAAYSLIIISGSLCVVEAFLCGIFFTYGCPTPFMSLGIFPLPIISLALTAHSLRIAGGYTSSGSVCLTTSPDGPALLVASLILTIITLLLLLYMIIFCARYEEERRVVTTGHSSVAFWHRQKNVHWGMWRHSAGSNPLSTVQNRF